LGRGTSVAQSLRKFALPLSVAVIDERERWVLWLPVFLGIGIAVYFALPGEPPPQAGFVALIIFGLAAFLGYRRPLVFILAALCGVMALGFFAAQLRTARVEAPVLQSKIGPVTVSGTVGRTTLLAPGGFRVVIENPVIQRLPREETPRNIRISVKAKSDTVRPGDKVTFRAVLMPTPEPVAPGAYDFARQAWFDRIGAVGYGVSGLRRLAPETDDRSLMDQASIIISRVREVLAGRIRSALPRPSGTIAAALMTGDRGGIPQQVISDLRDSGLAHLLAISGLHVGLLAGILFFAVRGCLALWEGGALRFPIKKWAAGAALAGAFGYLLLTGASVSTQRAFIMTAIVLFAVMVDRAAVSMRLVAWAAAFVLLLAPESLWHAGFQMSFAAVIALIATYEALREYFGGLERRSLWRRLVLYAGGVLLTSFVAGLATAPFAAFHFNRFIIFGLAANMIAVPVTALWVMPWGMLAYVLMPFGLEGLAVVPMGWGIEAITAVAHHVAGWPGSVVLLPVFPSSALILISLGGLWLCLWTRKWRYLGFIPAVAGIFLALAHRAPDILVDRDGKLLAVRGATGELSISGNSRSFVAERWLRRTGQKTTVPWPRAGQSSDGWLQCDGLGCRYSKGGLDEHDGSPLIVALVRKGMALPEDCRSTDIVISTIPVRRHCPSARIVIDRFDLWRNGAYAVWLGENNVKVLSANDLRGNRPLTRKRGSKMRAKLIKSTVQGPGGL